MQREFGEQRALLDTIIGHLEKGMENLDILLWAAQNRVPACTVVMILERLNINNQRLNHRYYAG